MCIKVIEVCKIHIMELSNEEIFNCLLKKISETEYLIKECNTLSEISGKAKLQRKIEAELRFLKRVRILAFKSKIVL